jgi:hypothetical protein
MAWQWTARGLGYEWLDIEAMGMDLVTATWCQWKRNSNGNEWLGWLAQRRRQWMARQWMAWRWMAWRWTAQGIGNGWHYGNATTMEWPNGDWQLDGRLDGNAMAMDGLVSNATVMEWRNGDGRLDGDGNERLG